MADYVTAIRTEKGDKQIDYQSLARKPESDTTLSKSGAFADAKAVGDKIKDINTKIENDIGTAVNNINTSIGTIETDIDNINAKIGSIDAETDIGTKLNEIDTKIEEEVQAKVDEISNIEINGKKLTGDIDLGPTDVGAAPAVHTHSFEYIGTLFSDGWTKGSNDQYSQSITVPGLLSTDTPFVDLDLSGVTNNHVAVIDDWSLVGRCVVSADGKVDAYCYTHKPTSHLPVVFKVVR